MSTRHLFHHQGLTDLAAMRREAQEKATAGERVVLHLHEYEDGYDGCPPYDEHLDYESGHELYEGGDR